MFPHSDTHGLLPTCGSPWLFAAYRVLHRRLVPRHPPYALFRLIVFRRYSWFSFFFRKNFLKLNYSSYYSFIFFLKLYLLDILLYFFLLCSCQCTFAYSFSEVCNRIIYSQILKATVFFKKFFNNLK